MKYIDFNDESIPIGKRKVAYVKYAMSKGTPEIKARAQANRKFGFAKSGETKLIESNCWKCKRGYITKKTYGTVVGCEHAYDYSVDRYRNQNNCKHYSKGRPEGFDGSEK